MPSKEVLESLQQLHDELNKLEPAIKHIETAVEVTNTVKQIPEKHIELLSSIREADRQARNKIEEDFSKRVQEIHRDISNVVESLNSLRDEITEYLHKLQELRDQIQSYYQKIEGINFPDRLDKIDNTISGINIGMQNLQSGIKDFETKISVTLIDLKSKQKRGNTYLLIMMIMMITAGLIGGYLLWRFII